VGIRTRHGSDRSGSGRSCVPAGDLSASGNSVPQLGARLAAGRLTVLFVFLGASATSCCIGC
jgi:hypothetical protein